MPALPHRPAAHRCCQHGRSARKGSRFRCRSFQFVPPPPPEEKPQMRVRLSVHYRVPRRQMLCVGGDKLPFGWSFMSIAHVPMTWNPGDVWSVEVDLNLDERISYKYVILEEQEWTKLENPSAQGVVTKHRTGTEPAPPPDNETIQMKMAIVSWQPGPNRVLKVPSEEELAELSPGDVRNREPARPRIDYTEIRGERVQLPDISEGTVEVLSMSDEEGGPFLDRRDVWAAPGWDEDPYNYNYSRP